MWRLHLAHHTDLADVRLEEIPAVVVATGSGWGALSKPSRTHTEQRKNVVFPQGYPCWRFVGVRSLSVAPNLRFPRAQSRDVRPTREASGSALTVVGPPGVVGALVLKQHRLAQPPPSPVWGPVSCTRVRASPRGPSGHRQAPSASTSAVASVAARALLPFAVCSEPSPVSHLTVQAAHLGPGCHLAVSMSAPSAPSPPPPVVRRGEGPTGGWSGSLT